MIVPTRIWEYLLASIFIIIAPGPSVLFVIALGTLAEIAPIRHSVS